MSEISAAPDLDREIADEMGANPVGLTFVSQEPLDTMLKLERLPPPVLAFSSQSGNDTFNYRAPIVADSNARSLQAVGLRLNLARLIIASAEVIEGSGSQKAVEGLNEVHRFLQHTEHLKILREG